MTGARCELHFHLLPSVDDGPRDVDEALTLARLAIADGTGLIVATPHVSLVVVDELAERVRDLRAAIALAGLEIEVDAGGELSDPDVGRLSQGQLELVAHGPPGRRWLLLEAPLDSARHPRTDAFLAALDELLERGFGVLVGHPERSGALSRDGVELLGARLGGRVRLQVNASSIVGAHGPHAQARALDLFRRGWVSAVASDAHSPARPPRLGDAVAALERAGMARAVAERLVSAAPRELLDGGIGEVSGRAA